MQQQQPAVAADESRPEESPSYGTGASVNTDYSNGETNGEATPKVETDGGTGSHSSSTVSVTSSYDDETVQKWVELLENRPDQGDAEAMATWVLGLMDATGGGGPASEAQPKVSQAECVHSDHLILPQNMAAHSFDRSHQPRDHHPSRLRSQRRSRPPQGRLRTTTAIPSRGSSRKGRYDSFLSVRNALSGNAARVFIAIS